MDVSRYPKIAQRLCRDIEEHRVLANWLYVFPLVEQLRAKENKLNVLADYYFYEAKFEQLLLSLYHGELRPGDDVLTLTPECQKSLERAMEMFRKIHHDCGRSGLANEAWCEDAKFLSKLLLCKARFLTVQSSEQFGQLVHNLEDDANLDKIVATRFGANTPSPSPTMINPAAVANAVAIASQPTSFSPAALAKLPPNETRMCRIIAEAYMLKAIAMEKSAPASASRFKRIEYEEKVNAAYNVAADLTYIYFQLLSQRLLTVSLPGVATTAGAVGGLPVGAGSAALPATAGGGGAVAGSTTIGGGVAATSFPGAAYTASGANTSSGIPSPAFQTAMLAGIYPTQQSMHEKLVGIILETGLLKGPQLLLLHSQPLWAISQLRDNLHNVQPAPAQLLRLEMLLTLAELVLRRAFGKHFISPRQTTTMLLAQRANTSTAASPQQQLLPEGAATAMPGNKLFPQSTASGTARRRPEIYAAPNMFLPITTFEEVLLLLLLSEAVCYQINPMINNAALNATAPNNLAASNVTATTRTSANSGLTAEHGHHHTHHHGRHEQHNVTTTTTTHHDKTTTSTSPQPPPTTVASPVTAAGTSSSLLILPEAAPAPMNILEDILTTNQACTEYAQVTCDMLDLWLAHNDLHPLLVPCIERAIRASTALNEGLRRKRAQCLHANGYARQAELFYDALFTQPPVEGQTGAARDDAEPPAVVARLQPHALFVGRYSAAGSANRAAAASAGGTVGNSQIELLDDTFGYNSMDRRELLLMRAVNLIESHLNVEAGIDIAQQLLDELLFDTSVMVADMTTDTVEGGGGRRAPSAAALVGINSDTNAPTTGKQRQQQQRRSNNNAEKVTADYKRAQSTPAGAREQYRVTLTPGQPTAGRRPRLVMSALDRALFVKAKILQGIGWAYRAKQRNVAYKRRQFEDRAMAAFHKAVEMDRDDPFVHFQLAYQYCLSRQVDTAASHVKMSLTLDPNFLHAIHLFALILSGQKQHHRALQLLEEKTYGVRDVNISLTRIKLEALCRGPEAALDSCRALLHQWKELYEGDFVSTSIYAGLMGGGGGVVGGGGGGQQQQNQAGSNRVSASHFYYHDNIIGGDDFDNDYGAPPLATTTTTAASTNPSAAAHGVSAMQTSTSGHLMMPYVATGGSLSNAGGTTVSSSGPGSVVGGTASRAQRRSTPKPGGAGSIISGVNNASNNTSSIAANAAHDASADIEEFTASVVGADGVGTAAASAIGQYSAIMGCGNGSEYASTAGGHGSLTAANAARYGFSAPGVMSQILILSEMAELYVKAGKVGDAWQCLVVGEQLRFGSYLLMHLRGVLNAELGDFDEARHSLQHALAINAWHVPSLVKLGQLAHAVFNDRQLAEKCFRDSIHADPFAHAAWSGLGTLAEEQNDFATAAFYFDEAQKCMRTEPVRSISFVPRNYSQRFSNA